MSIRLLNYVILANFFILLIGCTSNLSLINKDQTVKNKPSIILDKKSRRVDNFVDGLVTRVVNVNLQNEQFHMKEQNLLTLDKVKAASVFYLKQYRHELNLENDVLQSLEYHSSPYSNSSDSIVVDYRQYINQLPIVGGGATILMNSRFQLIKITTTLVENIEHEINVNESVLSKKNALSIALKDLTKQEFDNKAILFDKNLDQYTLKQSNNTWQIHSPIVIHKVYFSTKDGLQLAYQMSLRGSDIKHQTHHYGYIVSVKSGRILQKKNYLRTRTSR